MAALGLKYFLTSTNQNLFSLATGDSSYINQEMMNVAEITI